MKNNQTEEPQCDLPIFYVYRDKDGKMVKTTDELTQKLNSDNLAQAEWLRGHEFLPQWREPKFRSMTRPAWYINEDGERLVRTRELVRKHDPKRHAFCAVNSDGTCVCRVAKTLIWDDRQKYWVQQQD